MTTAYEATVKAEQVLETVIAAVRAETAERAAVQLYDACGVVQTLLDPFIVRAEDLIDLVEPDDEDPLDDL